MKKVVPVYIVTTADKYSLICYISSELEEVARFLNLNKEEVKNKLNNASKIGNYRVSLLNLKYTKDEFCWL